MAKTLAGRLDDTAVALVRHLGTTGYGLLAAILSALQEPDIASRREEILGALSLGWRGPKAFQRDARTEERKLERALILARLTIGGEIRTTGVKLEVRLSSAASVATELRRLYAEWLARQALPAAVAPQARIELAPSFSVTNSYERYAVTHCISRAVALVLQSDPYGRVALGAPLRSQRRLSAAPANFQPVRE